MLPSTVRASRRQNRRAFTLIELLVVIAIIAVLIGLLLPAVQKVREASLRARCQNNLHQIGIALHAYHDINATLPPGTTTSGTYWYWSWMARILPYIEQDNLYSQANTYATTVSNDPWSPNPALGVPLRSYFCPMDPRGDPPVANNPSYFGVNGTIAFTSYLGNSGTAGGSTATYDGVLYADSQVRLTSITDGTGNTIAVGERPPSQDLNFGWWFAGWGYNGTGTGDVVLGSREAQYTTSGYLKMYANGTTIGENCPATNVGLQPGNITNPCDQTHYWSFHPGGANFLMCDGSARFLQYSADSILPALSTRAGGEVFTMP
jgi:prepilin-type N-terminal cleavage/methylation domain-containing protein/prepilin-type processing-associated H-X9-DG protein